MSREPWWKVARAQSLERKAAIVASNAGSQPGDAFLIVTEGQVSEPIYFELLRSALQLPAVKIRVEPGSASHPRHVINSAAKEAAAHAERADRGQVSNAAPKRFDQVWAVIDTDVAVREGIWAEVVQLAHSKKVKLAHSSPCFEFWLLLHIQGYTTRADLDCGDTAKYAVKKALGCDYGTNEKKARIALSKLFEKWPDATIFAEMVRKYHLVAGSDQPANPSTEVCALVRALDGSAPLHFRRI